MQKIYDAFTNNTEHRECYYNNNWLFQVFNHKGSLRVG